MVSVGMATSVHPTAFFTRQADGSLLATAAARGPWSNAHQHGGPPTALIARAVETFGPDAAEYVVTRLTAELLAPVPLASPLTVEIEPVRLGNTAQRFAARLRLPTGDVVVEASALRLRRAEVPLPAPRHEPVEPLADPSRATPWSFPFFSAEIAYHTAVEVRVVRGTWGEGACAAWLRPRIPLVAGEPLTPLQGLTIVADAANGIAMALDVRTHTFVNPDITISMARPPQGLWTGIDAHSQVLALGTGLNDCGLYDEAGELGRVLQSLVVRAREPA